MSLTMLIVLIFPASFAIDSMYRTLYPRGRRR